MLPMWKVKREILRAKDHVRFPFIAMSGPMRRGWHDFRKDRTSRYTAGQAPVGPNVVLYLLYQPKGLLASSVETCRYFAAKGFSVFIVSNAPLSDADRSTLCGLSFGVLERENFGYDFGGYRDGILHLLDAGVQMDKLLIMNDSVWFPTFAGEDFLDHVLAAKTDLYGAVLSQRKQHMAQRHLQSYAVSFGKKLLASADFAQFWRKLTLSSNREWTIRNCEVQLTVHFRKLGYTLGARWGFESLGAVLDKLSDAELKDLLRLEAELERKRAPTINALIANYGSETWRAKVTEFVDSHKFRKQIMLLHPAALSQMNFPFMKKSREPFYGVLRPLYAKWLADKCQPTMLTELSHWD